MRRLRSRSSKNQLHLIDRWRGISLALTVAVATFASLPMGAGTAARSDSWSPASEKLEDNLAAPQGKAEQTTTGAGGASEAGAPDSHIADPDIRNSISVSENSFGFDKLNAAHDYSLPEHQYGERRQTLPLVY
jgi:hypothetical protein